MTGKVEVLFTPAEFRGLRTRDLARTTCVVFDVLRATSTMITALAAGARGILPVGEIAEALAAREREPGVLLAGERNGWRLGGALTGGVEFDLGNSPREFTPAVVGGKMIVTTTTNGTRALRACAGAEEILLGSFLNLTATIRHLLAREREQVCLVCAGTGEEASWEDALGAGALCERLKSIGAGGAFADSAVLVWRAFLQVRTHLADALGEAGNARRLLRLPELRDDVEFCIQQDAFDFAAPADPDGWFRRRV